jgi:hypothetical protein
VCGKLGRFDFLKRFTIIELPHTFTMIKTLVCINTLTAVKSPAYANHIQFFFRLGRNFPDHQFALWTPNRMTIDTCRNMACKVALENEFDYVMMVDDDVLVPFDAYGKMVAADKDIVAGWTIIRGYPYNNMHFIYNENKDLTYYNEHEPEGMLDVDAVGCSLTLIKCELLKKINPPYFVTGTNNTEDIYFCCKARQAVPECTIAVDLSIKTGHILTDQIVTAGNKHIWKKHEEEEEPHILEPQHTDRTEKYLEINGIS